MKLPSSIPFLILIFILSSYSVYPQVVEDVKISPELVLKRDSIIKAGDRYGNYLSCGIGFGGGKSLFLKGLTASYSFAFKTYIVSIGYWAIASYILGVNEYANNFSCTYSAILFGKAIRKKLSLVSFSTGIAKSDVTFWKFPMVSYGLNAWYYGNVPDRKIKEIDWSGYSIPVEFKFFHFVPNNNFGVGLSANINIVPQYTSSLFSVSIVWNLGRGAFRYFI